MKNNALGFVGLAVATGLLLAAGNAHAIVSNLTGSSIRVSGTTVLTAVTTSTMTDATDGVGNVTFSTQYFGSGSGVYTALFRVQNQGNSGPEQGYNSYASGGPPMDQKNGVGDPELVISGSSTTVNELTDARVEVDGQLFFQFTLDLNEDQSTGRFISLDNIAIYTTSRTTDPKYTTLAEMNADSQLNAVWRMDYGTTNQAVLLNANLSPGSGHDNMVMLVPVSLFASAAPTDHVYLYTQFGVFNTGGVTTEYLNGSTWTSNSFVAESTFEEWSMYKENAIPEPSTVMLLGLSAFAFLRRRRR